MRSWLRQLDDLLRGRRTVPEQLTGGEVALALRRFLPMAAILGGIYGFFMGWYALFGDNPDRYWQVLASTVKLPALFLLTLLVTFPSLYVFNALMGCRLSFMAMLRLLVGAIVINVVVAASLGPILGFFTVSTTSYPFMILLNVALMGIAGLVGLSFLLQTLRRLSAESLTARPKPDETPPHAEATGLLTPPPTVLAPSQVDAKPAPATDETGETGDAVIEDDPPSGAEILESDEETIPMATPVSPPASWKPPGALDALPEPIPEPALGYARVTFRIWLLIYALVGAQMGWVLRPFIGSPNMPFQWFRQREGNFFQSVVQQIVNLFGG
jgi:hypothetical protein